MDERIKEIARKMGAKIVTQLPDVEHGALGAAHYAAFYRKRMEHIRIESTTSPFTVVRVSLKYLPAGSSVLWQEAADVARSDFSSLCTA